MIYRIERGYYVPAKDIGCSAVVFNSLGDLDGSLKLCRERNVAVQAGGNFGVWPKYLSEIFKTVYTFEPDALNFSCLCRNIGDVQNIIKFQAALGDGAGGVDLHRREENAGAHYIDGVGPIPILKIDALALTACDLIVLDIEGFELPALRGAIETIKKCHPVIHIEDKGMSEKYGIKQGDAEKWLSQFGYTVKDRPARDVILSC